MNTRVAALDGLRALCVLAVFVNGLHWLMPFGWIGVQVFYVLSGHLITDVLVRQRRAGDAAGTFFRRFHLRRALRIFPVYFCYLLALQCASWGWPSAVPDWSLARWYALTFTTNIGFVLGAFTITDAIGHLWSLAVEQQFYLLWPLVIWFTPARALPALAVALVMFGPAVRVLGERALGYSPDQTYLASQSHLDAFACGALVSWASAHLRHVRSITVTVTGMTLLAGLWVMRTRGLALRTLGYPEGLYAGGAHIWGYTLIDLSAALCIACLLRGHMRGLAHPALAYVGRISYAIYLFQRPLMRLCVTFIEPTLLHVLPKALAYLCVAILAFGAAVVVAALSDRWLERPLLTWRDRTLPAAA